MTQLKQWRGLKALVADAVEHGSRAVERVHLETANRPFRVMELIPVLTAPARVVHDAHDAAVVSTYASIRLVNRAVSAALDITLDALEHTAPAAASEVDRTNAT